MKLIEINKVNKFFGEGATRVHVLKDISLEIAQGEFVAVIGQSGSGKSTLMNLFGCLDTADSGTYRVNGVDVGTLDPDGLAELRCTTFGFIFQRYNLLSSLNALDNVALPAAYNGMAYKDRTARAATILSDLGLTDKLKNKPNELSGGQQQRVSIGRALMNGGQIILADEPTGALDSASGEMVMEILKELHRKGHTIILVTHDRTIAASAHRLIEIHDGRIISDTRTNQADINALAYTKEKRTRISRPAAFKNQFRESLSMSLQAVAAHKLRSILTMLGIIIGIASVVSVVALGKGSQEKILSDISAMGTNTITIYPGKGFGDRRSTQVKTLVVSDSNALAKQPYLDSATPSANASGVLAWRNIAVNASVNGVGAQYFDVKGLEAEFGRLFNNTDVRNNASVVVIDQNTRNTLFPDGEDPLGKVIIFSKQPLKIIGVTKKQQTVFGPTDTLNLWAPYTTVMYKLTGNRDISSITVKVKDDVNSQVAEKNITDLLIARHGTQDFFTQNTDSIKQTVESTTGAMTLLISCIALISLVVGGIGVMNIMLVSVTERTREIGVRMSIGARRYNILEQFLIEAVLLCLMGGMTGIALSYIIGAVFNEFAGQFRMAYSNASIVLAICCSTGIGIIFGFMPARNAAGLNPIEALARD